VVLGALDTALGSYGAFVACDQLMARYLSSFARAFMFACALPPSAAAGALAALALLEARPQLVARLTANSRTLRQQLELEGFYVAPADTQIVSLVVEDPAVAVSICDRALARGVFAQPIIPPAVAPLAARVRLAAMASHHGAELRAAARVLAQAARDAGFDPTAVTAAPPAEPPPQQPTGGVFDFEARAA
jgi:glycine C-acetyltransferase